VYAAIESVSGIPHEEGGRWLWSWSSSLSSGVVEDEVRKSLVSRSTSSSKVVIDRLLRFLIP
jgi:hypothetical protein